MLNTSFHLRIAMNQILKELETKLFMLEHESDPEVCNEYTNLFALVQR